MYAHRFDDGDFAGVFVTEFYQVAAPLGGAEPAGWHVGIRTVAVTERRVGVRLVLPQHMIRPLPLILAPDRVTLIAVGHPSPGERLARTGRLGHGVSAAAVSRRIARHEVRAAK